MEQTPWSDAASEAPIWLRLDLSVDGTILWLGAPGQGALDGARSLLEAGRPFILVARNLPEAVRITQTLAPEEADVFARVAQVAEGPAKVALFRAHVPTAERTSLLSGLDSGERLGLILTPADLANPGVPEAISALKCTPALLVQDAHRVSASAPDFDHDCLALEAVHGVSPRVLYTDLESPPVMMDLGRRFGFGPEALVRGDGDMPLAVTMSVELDKGVLESRGALKTLLDAYLPKEDTAYGVVVAPKVGEGIPGGLPLSELLSVGEELGLQAVSDPGEDADAQKASWLRILRRNQGLLLTDDPAALSILPEGSNPVFFRLVAPISPEAIHMECRRLARIGGGRWVYSGSPSADKGGDIDIAALKAVLTPLLAKAEGEGPLAFDARGLLRRGGLLGPGVDEAALLGAFLQELQVLSGLGLFRQARRVRLNFIVSEGRRFGPPHIDANPVAVNLHRRYTEAVGEMSMGDSIRFRLEAREPHDLREWSQVLGMDVFTLNGIFDDLARDGILVCRQVPMGGPMGLDIELVPEGSWDDVRGRLDAALQGLDKWRARRVSRLAQVSEVLAAEDAPAALALALGQELDHLTLPISRELAGPPNVPFIEPTADITPTYVAPSAQRTQPPEEVTSFPAQEPAPEAPAPGPSPWDALLADIQQDHEAGGGLAVSKAMALAVAAQNEGVAISSLEGLGDYARLGTIFWQVLEWEAEEAIAALIAWSEEGAGLPWGEIIPRVEFLAQNASGEPLLDLPQAVLDIAMALPLVEALPVEAAKQTLEDLRGELDVSLKDLGSAKVILEGGEEIHLERRGGAPEVEARLWLALGKAGVSRPPAALQAARLGEFYLALAGLGDGALTQELSRGILALGAGGLSFLPEERASFAIARAYVESGDKEKGLEALLQVTAPEGLEREHARSLGQAAADASAMTQALDWAFAQGDARQVSRVVAALKAMDETRDVAVEVLGAYTPAGVEAWDFVIENPFQESSDQGRARLLALEEGPKSLSTLMSLKGLLGPEGVAQVLPQWIDGMEGEGQEWLSLTVALGDENQWASAALIFPKLYEESGVDATALKTLQVREALSRGSIPDALAAAEGLPLGDIQRLLHRALGQEWLTALGEVELAEGAVADLGAALIAAGETWEKRRNARKALDSALKGDQWEEILPAMAALEALIDEGGDRALSRAQGQKEKKVKALRGRLTQLEERDISRLHPTPLARLRDELRLLGDEEGAVKAEELRVQVEAQAPAQASAASAPPRQSPTNRASQQRAPRERRPSPSAPRIDPRTFLEGPSEGLRERLTEGLSKCPGDRERGTLVLEALKRFNTAGDMEAGLKGLRDSLPSFERLDALDMGLGRLIADGIPGDDHLPRLKRILEKNGMRFRKSIEAIATRENPEPWKQLLSQLKVKA